MEDTKQKNRIWINPCDCGCDCDEDDEDMYNLSYELPGVDKKDIDLKVSKDALRLIARRGEIEYYNEFPFVCEVDDEHTQALYENGLLTVRVPLNCPTPFEDAKKISISG